jgi:hypothetical protein
MATTPTLINYSTKLCAEELQPVFDVAYGALDKASTPELARTALDVYSTSEVYTKVETDQDFINANGDQMIGHLQVPPGATGSQAMQASEITTLIETRLGEVWPIGSIYLTLGGTSPSTMLPGTTWELIAAGTFLAAAGTGYVRGATGGEAQHTLTLAEMPSHDHGMDANARVENDTGGETYSHQTGTGPYYFDTQAFVYSQGSDQPHENRPPYLAVDMWQRTA